MNSAKTRVAMGLTLAIVGMTGAFAVKNGLAEIQRVSPPPEIAATAVASPHHPSALKTQLAASSAESQNAVPTIEPDPFANDPLVPRAEITTVEAAGAKREDKTLLPIPETEEFHSRIFRGTASEDVSLPLNESAPNARDPE